MARTTKRGESPRRRIGLFVEGRCINDPSGRVALRDLWQELAAKTSGTPQQSLLVYGFTKGNIIAMADSPAAPRSERTSADDRLDVVIAAQHDADAFDVLLVAFDAHPANKAAKPNASGRLDEGGGKPCRRWGTRFVLRKLAESKVLPEKFKKDAAQLLARYEASPKEPRPAGRPPRSSLDLLYMDPEFEALVAQDDGPLRRVLHLPKRPKDWPALPSDNPKGALAKMIESARDAKPPRHLRGRFRDNPHGWALELVRQTDPAELQRHPIGARLALLLA